MKSKQSGKKSAQLVMGVTNRTLPSRSQLRYVNNLLSFKERVTIAVCALLMIAAVGWIGVYHYFATTQAIPTQGGEYTEAIVGYPEYINPILAQTNDVDLDIAQLVFSSLFQRTKDQRLEPDLVTDYTISEDQLTYTLYLRRDAYWHDGTPLTVDDVIFTIDAIQDPNWQSPLEPSLRGVIIQKIDDYTLTLSLDEPFAPFLSALTFGILPQHIWFDAYRVSVQNITLSEYNIKPVGSGPFMFDKLVKDGSGNLLSYHLMPFDKYYGQQPYFESVSFAFYPDLYSATEAFRREQVTGLAFVSPDQKAELQKDHKQLEYYHLQLPQYTAIFFNQEHSDVLANDAVRQALVWGVDRDKIISEVLQSEGEGIYTPILEGYIGHNPEVEKYGFDIEKGNAILEEGGWKYAEGAEFRSKGNQTLEFSIATIDQPEFLDTLNILKENWTKMGIKVTVNIYASQDIQESIIKPREYEALLFGEIIGLDPDPYAFWHSTQMEHPGLALAVFYDKEIDGLLEQARKTSDEEKRRQSYLHFQNNLAEAIPAIFLYNPYYTYAVHQDVQGVDSRYITMPADRFSDIENWYFETQRVKKTL